MSKKLEDSFNTIMQWYKYNVGCEKSVMNELKFLRKAVNLLVENNAILLIDIRRLEGRGDEVRKFV